MSRLLKISGVLWQYYRDEAALDANDAITDFNEANATALFNLNAKIAGQTGNNSTKVVSTMVPLKYLSKFWRTLEMHLINCEINLDLNWSTQCVIVATTEADQGAITDTKLYVPVVTLLIQHNIKLLERLKSGFKRTII